MAQDCWIHYSGHDLSRIRDDLHKLAEYDLIREYRKAVIEDLTSVLLGNGFP